jgi:hypothetical protein
MAISKNNNSLNMAMLGHFFSKKPKKGDSKQGALDILSIKVHKDKREKRVGLN